MNKKENNKIVEKDMELRKEMSRKKIRKKRIKITTRKKPSKGVKRGRPKLKRPRKKKK